MNCILIGEEGSKRTEYFRQAGAALAVEVALIPLGQGLLSERQLGQLVGAGVKIDPLKYPSSALRELPYLVNGYNQILRQLAEVKGAFFLNHPQGILTTLDKVACKEILLAHDVPTTPMLQLETASWSALQEQMQSQKINRVFIKPRFGSGAAGVLAYSYEPRRNQEALYGGLSLIEGQLHNSKCLTCYKDSATIRAIGEAILANPVIVERWLPKAQHQGQSYDLRVVWQFGHIAYIVARLSKSPITNLHLNNNATPWQALQLPKEVWKKVAELADQAMALFPTLQMGGLDILLSGEKLKPYIIEINGQGDLIYQDIFQDNSIYTQQIERMISR